VCRVTPRDSQDKISELLLHVAVRTHVADSRVDLHRLHTVLYFSDRACLRAHGSTITDGEYARWPEGPVLRSMRYAIKEMENRGDAQVVGDPDQGQWLIALREPGLLGHLSDDELAVVDDVVSELTYLPDRQLMMLIEDDAGWAAAEDGEPILMEMAFITRPEVTDKVRERAEQLARQQG